MKNKKFVWCSVHQPSEVQIQELRELGMETLEFLPAEIQDKLNNSPDNSKGLIDLAEELSSYIGSTYGYDHRNLYIVQLGGSPMFQKIFASRIIYAGYNEQGAPWKLADAYSERVSEDQPQADGTVKKVSVFKHKHFIVY